MLRCDGQSCAMQELSGRIALVTGAQQGIGAAVALTLAKAGADVAVNWLDQEPLELADAIRAQGVRCALVQGSVDSVAGVQALHAEATRALGVPDLLVNNAGIFPRCDFLDMREEEWDAVLGINVKAAAFLTQAFARALGGREGAVVNLSSSAVRGDPRGVHYTTSKTGIIGLTRATALALAPHHIRVNAIAPGLTDTAQPRYGNSEDELAARAATIPIPRMGRAEEIADLAQYLLGPRAAWITGQVWHINGGLYLP
ncbi:SDR family oxidoreductase [Rhodovarius crocodyli]|uniref:SDR family oxidoreductase n=1 Tax=Rhodovarius crocodyli TaxID=1979269 RepID=A0A437MCL2_9PROT|nr:SDR family oxidoreductase [Rhodovarius crocodyli]RVT95303.1 SDR family oxidoreductase [Rhodovarius crocodyli]